MGAFIVWNGKWLAASLLIGMLGVTTTRGAERAEASPPVEFFAAIKRGEIEAKIIPRDEKVGTVIVTNKTNRPLTIKLPGAFVGLPVVAQFGAGLLGNNFGNNFGANQGNPGANQALGGAMRQPGGQQNPFGAGIFNVGPERAIKLRFNAVCLEHDKRSPNTRIPYRLAPLDEYTSDSTLIELISMLDRREIDQPTAQAAAWHVANGVTWDKLAKRISARHLNGTSELFFTTQQIEAARDAVAQAERQAAGSVATNRETSQR
ncbi:MAG: hypothetical protein SFU86_19640 [Pirellulaceae bacterium]|nr:hypothetical protein [Pirellulaceae bacterium]